ncbi:hypothetical protein [Lelliottia amnigena]|uniref:hypothetical protein n=1 Tax=Lelliottia amnigena TaxID=61646 RepID=UPI00195E1B85|nr:hypothetical protein [Lelliottia amnigena]MBM7356709.1 hypothetical protein [Lelliottia amnigena]WSO18978.1 hypothetical protein VUJ45_18220 [Lelliottia amnigena]
MSAEMLELRDVFISEANNALSKGMIDYFIYNQLKESFEGGNQLQTYNLLKKLIHKSEYSSQLKNTDEIREELSESKNIILSSREEINHLKQTISTLIQEKDSIIIEKGEQTKQIQRLLEGIKNRDAIIESLTQEKQQIRIDEKIPEYVSDVSAKLDMADNFFTKRASVWSFAGIGFSLLAVTAAFCTYLLNTDIIENNEKFNLISISYIFLRGGIGIALLSWISFICFSNARSYTHESILRKDRQHALTFGRLFLQIYGSTATKEDAIKVFKDWNMSGDNAFSSKQSTPPNMMKYFQTFKDTITSSKDKKLTDEGKET